MNYSKYNDIFISLMIFKNETNYLNYIFFKLSL